MNRNEKLWSEMTEDEKEAERKEFLNDYAAEFGGSPEDYEMQWETYLNQEGWTGRDEAIAMKRDAVRLNHEC